MFVVKKGLGKIQKRSLKTSKDKIDFGRFIRFWKILGGHNSQVLLRPADKGRNSASEVDTEDRFDAPPQKVWKMA